MAEFKKDTVKNTTEEKATTEETAVLEANAEETGPKKVKVKLFKDNDRYKDDVFVSVNGESFQIQRGVEVEVPDYIAEVLAHAAEQRQSTALTIERLKTAE